ncbi:MAG: alanine transaminase [Candidatus Porifericomitaceae bacterium WSBS_2022_MAG_OTU9]
MQQDFARVGNLPPYVFSIVDKLKMQARHEGRDIIDFGMGNPDQPPAAHIVEKLAEAAGRDDTHRYSISRGIPRLRQEICSWYKRRYEVELDPETEAIVTMGSKDGLSHLALAVSGPGDIILVPSPAYPIHMFGYVIAGATVHELPICDEQAFFEGIEKAMRECWPKPKMLLVNYPSNPSATCVELAFFTRLVEVAKKHQLWLVQDLAYADLVYDGYKAPSILQVPGAKDLAVEFFTMSKSYNMPGWRVGFMVGNQELVHALTRIKSYLDYGLFTPIQVAAVAALKGPQDCVEEVRMMYQSRRDVLCDGLNAAGWEVAKPQATMFVWAKIPEPFSELGSLEFAKQLLLQAEVAVSPGIGFGTFGEGWMRFSLIENEHRTRQAVRGIRDMLRRSEPI